jgi:hypothetical protein
MIAEGLDHAELAATQAQKDLHLLMRDKFLWKKAA